MIKAVIFDVDGVLLDSFEANLKYFQDLMVKAGYMPPGREDFRRLFHLSMMDVIRTLTKSDSEEEIKRIWGMRGSGEVQLDASLLSVPEGAAEVVKLLSKKYSLGIVTSRVRETVFESPDLERLKKYFPVAVAFQDTENHKPHPDPLLLAAEKLAVKPEECVYVGDMPTDVEASKAAGMKIVVYSSEKLDGANASTYKFGELPELIAGL